MGGHSEIGGEREECQATKHVLYIHAAAAAAAAVAAVAAAIFT